MRFIVTSDLHFRNTVPRCRKETEQEWLDFQLHLFQFILEQTQKYNADLIIAGDLFDRANPGLGLINSISNLMQKYEKTRIYVCAGQHDLPYHSWNLVNNSGIGILINDKIINNNVLFTLHINHWGLDDYNEQEFVVCHHLVFPNKKLKPPNINAYTALELFEKYPQARYIFCGDNHNGFISEYENKILIVPGSVYIGAVDQIEYMPKIWLVDTDKNKMEPINLPNPLEMISTEYIGIEKERDERMNAFINIIESNEEITLSFTNNLRKKMLSNKISEDVKNIVIEVEEEYHV